VARFYCLHDGLSIGIHLLNLLAIPAIVLVYYFRKYQVTRAGVIKALIIAAVLLGSIMYILIPGLVKIAVVFELLFVNTFGLPFNSGTLVYIVMLTGLIGWGMYYTHSRMKVILNTVILFIAVIVIGYSSYAMLIIRSMQILQWTKTILKIFFLLYYLNREQYGDRRLFTDSILMPPFWVQRKEKRSGFLKTENISRPVTGLNTI